MKTILVVGGSGYIGRSVIRELVAAGYGVSAASRSPDSDAMLENLGATPFRGSLEEHASIVEAAAKSDGIVYAPNYIQTELDILDALIAALGTREAPFVFVSGASMVAEETQGGASENRFDEFATPAPPKGVAFRLKSEAKVLEAAGIRGIVMRPPIVYGLGGSRQIPMIAANGRKTGTIRYIGAGENQWATVHVDDLARMIVRAIDRPAKGIFHPVSGEVSFGDLARAIGVALDLPVASWTFEEATEGYGVFPAKIALGSSCRPVNTRGAELDWEATEPAILEDVATGSYKQKWAAARNG